MSARDTNHWTGVGAVTLLAVGLGAIVEQPPLLLAGVAAVGYAAWARMGEAPTPALRVERELSTSAPEPGDDVRVTVTVENVGDGTLLDLRVVDGVPPALAVPDGAARLGTALRSGKEATFSYVVTAVRGEHEWEPLTAVSRNASLSRERTTEVEAETTLRCLPELYATSELPLRGLTTPYSGRVATDVAGEGVEFHSTRTYRQGDPLNRVDWNRFASTGQLSTLSFREERAANVVLLLDARTTAYCATDEDEPNAVERGVDAASQAFSALLDSGDRVGLAALAAAELWLAPGAGDDHRAEARRLLATHPALAPTPTPGRYFPAIRLRELRRRLPSDAQLIVFSPLVDDYVVTLIRRLHATGHLVTVVSPDATAADSTGRRLARVERMTRLMELRRSGVRVVDWGDEPLALALAAAEERWSA